MKKLILLITILGISLSSVAQDDGGVLKNKKGFPILPQAGDFAIGFDAVPMLDFALNTVNIMNNTGQTAQHPGYVGGFNQVIVGKYFITDDMAYRGRLGINSSSFKNELYGDDPLTPTTADPENILISTTKNASMDVVLGIGVEYRRGYNKLQGYYGGEFIMGLSNSKTVNTYEIEYDQTAQDSGYIFVGSSRVLSNKSGTSLSFGLRGFVGVEYFILPKISLGAEFGWGLGFGTSPRGKIETEYWDIEPGSGATSPSQYVEEVEGNNKSRGFGFSVDDGINQFLGGSAALTMHFHF